MGIGWLFFIKKVEKRRILKMGKREQMIHAARRCLKYRRGRMISSCDRTCEDCMHCEGGRCMKEIFEDILVLT
jgi:hypothetical protein